MRRPLRLLFVLPDLDGGGAQRVTLNLLGALDPTRHAVTLLVLNAPGALSPGVPAHVRLIHCPPRLGLRYGALATICYSLFHDVLIGALETRATFYVHRAARLLRKPAIAWVHIAFEDYANGMSARNRQRSRAAYRDLSDLVFVSEGARRSMARWLGCERDSWRVIGNAFVPQPPAGTEPQEQAALRQRMQRRRSLLGIGRLETRKGFDLLIAAAAQARQAGADFDLIILGSGPLREELLAQAARLGIADRVFLPGFVAQPIAWLRCASAYVLSSRIEGLPTTIIEAMSARAPVIATDCPTGPAELLADGAAGLLVPVDDAAALAAAIVKLLADDALADAFREAGARRVQAYAPALIAAQWQQLFDEAVAKRGVLSVAVQR